MKDSYFSFSCARTETGGFPISFIKAKFKENKSEKFIINGTNRSKVKVGVREVTSSL